MNQSATHCGQRSLALGVLLAVTVSLGGCAGAIIGTAADVAIETAKIPFKVVGAVIDVVTDDDDD